MRAAAVDVDIKSVLPRAVPREAMPELPDQQVRDTTEAIRRGRLHWLIDEAVRPLP